MSNKTWHQALSRRLRQRRKGPRRGRALGLLSNPLRFESLEERWLLAAITVNDAGDGQTAGDTFCELREAIANANSNSDTTSGDCVAGLGDDTISFAAGLDPIVLGGTELLITSNIVITGNGADETIIDGDGISRVFNIFNGATVDISGVTIENGGIEDSGGGIRNEGDLTLSNSLITGNVAASGSGGGIFNFANGSEGAAAANLTVNNSSFSYNTATQNGGAIANYAYNDGVATANISNTTVSDESTASSGGGLSNHAYASNYDATATMNITGSTVSGNTATEDGGGVFNYAYHDRYDYVEATANLTISNSTISGNTADQRGGGIFNSGYTEYYYYNEEEEYGYTYADRAILKIANSTISGNTATNGTGGGIHNHLYEEGDGYYGYGTIEELHSTIVAGNASNSGGNDLENLGDLTSATFNLIQDPYGHEIVEGDGNNNIVDPEDPSLDPDGLKDNGGPTLTIALLEDGPAIDAGSNPDPPDSLITDQRGEPRTVDMTAANADDGTDIGAFELSLDFGDAPDPTYDTLLDNDGARHMLGSGLFLGASVDPEPDGQPNVTATGDDLDLTPGPFNTPSPGDEDGVTATTAFVAGKPASITVVASAPGSLDAWIDLDGSGTFDHPAEHLSGGTSVNVNAGPNVLIFSIPADAVTGTSFARLRISSAGSLPPTGFASDGEVEDYEVEILTPIDVGLSKAFSLDTIGPGSTSTLTFDITNDDEVPVSDLAFVDILPPGITIATPANAFTDCGDGVLTIGDDPDSISLSAGRLGPGAACSVTVNVIGSATATNITGDLTSSAGNSGPAVATLTVDPARPGFSKSFSPSSISLGATSTLTFTIDNSANGGGIGFLQFSDALPAGMIIATPANRSTDCGFATLTADPGASAISLFALGSLPSAPVVAAGATCTASVDVTTTANGTFNNTSGDLSYISGTEDSAGFATAALDVPRQILNKVFLDDPVIPGSEVTLQFTIQNPSRSEAATDIAFDDSLPAGLTFSSLINDDCGGVLDTATPSLLSYSSGSLPPEGSCTFSVTLDVPAGAAPGTYINTTTALTATIGGEGVVGNMATDELTITLAPTFTKEFIDDPVGAGGAATIRFTITNNNPTSSLSDIAFTDDLNTAIVGLAANGLVSGTAPMQVLMPLLDVCGIGSELTVQSTAIPPSFLIADPTQLIFTGGSLAPAGSIGDSCFFDVVVDIPAGIPGGVYTNTTSELTAIVPGPTPITGPAASAELVLVESPRLTKQFTDDPVAPGGTAELQFTIAYGDEETFGDATGIGFTDDLAATLSGLTVILPPVPDPPCGLGSSLTASAGDTLLTFAGGTLMPGEICTFSVSVQVPTGALPGSYTNNTSNVVSTVAGVPGVTGNAASDDLQIAGLTLTKEFTNDPVVPGDTVNLRFTIDNTSPVSAATSIFFSDDLDDVIPNMGALGLPISACGGTVSGSMPGPNGDRVFQLSGGSLTQNTSCSFDVTVQVPVGTESNTYTNRTSQFRATVEGTLVDFDNASDQLIVDSNRLSLDKTFTDDPVAPGDNVTVEFTLTNLDAGQAASAIGFSDDLGAALSGLTYDSLLLDTCGGTVSGLGTTMIDVSGASLGAGGACTIRASLLVPAAAATGVYTNTTSGVTGTIGGLAVTGDAASDDLGVGEPLLFTKSFDGPTTATGTPILTFTITNPTENAANGLAFSDNLDDVIPGLTATNLPLSDVCGVGSELSLSVTSLLTFTGGNLAANGGMCSFDVELLVPVTATAGTFPNTTSDLTASGLLVAEPATDDLVIEPPPTFAKVFAPDSITAGEISTLTFTIDNSASALAASDLSFIDNFPVGVVIADPTNASTTCAGGMGDASAGATSFSFAGGSVGAESSCTIQFDVTSAVPGMHVNTTGDLTSSSGNSGTASDTLTVTAIPPVFSKSFAPDSIVAGAVSTLTFTIDNTASLVAASDLSFIDNLPAGVVIADPTNASTTCAGGMGDASPGATSFSFVGGSVGAESSCTIQFDVTSVLPDTYVNTTEDLTSSSGNSGTATDTLTVTATPPVFSKSFAPDTIAVGEVSTLTFTVDNSASLVAASDLSFIDNLPAGVVIADPTNASTTCAGGMGDASPGASSFSFAGGSVGAESSCTIQFDVTSVLADTYVNTTNDLTSSSGNSGTATDSLIVMPAQPPTFSKSFAPNPIGLNETSALTFTIDNTVNAVPANSLDFTDNFPEGILIAATPNASTTCTGGVLMAAAGTLLVDYSGGSVAAGASRTVQVDVTGLGIGDFDNTSDDLTSSLGNSGSASDTLTVEPLAFDKSFLPGVIGVGSVSTLTFEIANLTGNLVTGLSFIDNLPAGLTIAAPANASSSCSGTVSAPAGGGTIELSEGGVAPLGSCTVTVDVTSGIADTYTNVTSQLQSLNGNASPATADLIVSTDRPGFTKSFSPDSISLGARSTLTFTIDNSGSQEIVDDEGPNLFFNGGGPATDLDFADNLPAGIVIAAPANASTTCNDGVLTAVAGTDVISYTMGSVGAGASCTVSVDVIGTAVGLLGNTSGELTSTLWPNDGGSQTVSSGKASAVLEVIGDPISLIKSFTDDPVPPGGTVTMQFLIKNLTRDESATDITFTDDLDAALSGLVAVGLPLSDVCGAGSELSGTSVLTLTGASLGSGESCTFSTTLQVPASAAIGVYPNTTSSIMADIGGESVTGAPASDDLFVQTAPLLTKSFTDDPVGAGGAVNLNFNIENTSTTFSAVDIAFTDNLDAALSGLTVATLPSDGFCGVGSSLTATPIGDPLALIMTGGILPAGGSCSFDVTLLVPAGAPSGAHTNTTSEITALVDDETLVGNPASDDLVVVAAPSLRKEFTDDPVLPGAMANLQFTLIYGDEVVVGDATNISFTDDLAAALAGLSAVGLPINDVCGAGSTLSGSTNLSFTGGTLSAGSTCTFSVPVMVPLASLPGTYVNETSNVSATVEGVTTLGPPASDELRVAGIAITKEFTDDPIPAGGTVTLEFTIENASQVADVTSISFTDDLDNTLTGLVATAPLPSDPCGTGSAITGTSFLSLTGGNLAAGESCTFSVTLQVPATAASDVYPNTTSALTAQFGGMPVTIEPATDTLIVASDLLLLDKAFAQDSAFPGDTVPLDFTITNLSATETVTDITFTDDLDAALAGLAAVGLPANDVCGAGSQLTGTSLLTLTAGTLGPGESCSFTAMVELPVDAPFGSRVENITSQATGNVGGLEVTGDPASDDLLINAFRFSKSFDGLTFPGGTPTLTFTIENLSETAIGGISFSDNLGAVIPGLVATGLPTGGVCGAGSQLAGTSVLTLGGASLGPGATCVFDVMLQVPRNAAAGTFTNTTSDLLVAGIPGASPAVDLLTVVPPPDFDKTFTPDGIPLTGTSTLSFAIDNSASPLGATSLAFTDNLPAGVTVAAPPNASTTCTGGTLTAVAGSSVIAYNGGAVAAGASCSVQVDVTSSLSGSHLNVSGDLTSSLGNSGPASATLISQIMLMGGPLTPGLNFLTTSKGLSDAITILVQGTQPGSTPLTVQGVTVTTAFADPVVIAFGETGANGSATFTLSVTEAQVGQTLQFQAFQLLPVVDASVVVSLPVVAAPLLAAGGQADLAHGESVAATALTPAMLRSVAAKAIERWEAMGLTQAEIDLLHSVTVKIADLPDGMLGQTVNTTISFDYSAAGYGWFVDATPGDGTEFGVIVSPTENGANEGGSADQLMDLYTAVLHEFGHILKFHDSSPTASIRGVMTAELPTSVRRLPTPWQNPSQVFDVNGDGSISALDALIVINEVNLAKFRDAEGRLPSVVPQAAARWFLDTNGDGFATAADALRIINRLNSFVAVAEGEGEVEGNAPQHVIDLALLGLQTELPSATTPAPRQTVVAATANQNSEVPAVPYLSSPAKQRDFQVSASEAESDLALLEWLEQQSSDDH